jgi:GTP-binding protein
LINAHHGVTAADAQVLKYLQGKITTRQARAPFSIQAVLTKVDKLPLEGGKEQVDKIIEKILESAPACLNPVLTSCNEPQLGIEQLRAAIVQGANFR